MKKWVHCARFQVERRRGAMHARPAAENRADFMARDADVIMVAPD
jgi:hypothetical protein